MQAVLAARIDRLPPEEKRLLQTAAVIGTEVPLPLLQAIAEMPEATLHRGLAHLQAAEFLYETRLFPEPEYTFKHALTHEVAYGSLLLERRRVLHARIVEALEALAPERVAEQVERLAHHALRGEVWDKAVTYCQQAGARAYDRAAFREAVASFEQALQALAHLPEDGDTRGLAIDLRLALERPLTPLGEMGGASPCWARPRPWPGRSTTGPGWDGCWPGWPMYSGSRETTTAPWRRASRPSSSRPSSATAPCRCKHPISWGRHTMPSATSAGRPSCCGGTWRRRTGSLARPVQTCGSSPGRGWRGP